MMPCSTLFTKKPIVGLLASSAVIFGGLAASQAQATAVVSGVTVFANGAAVMSHGPDSVTHGGGSVFVEYGNGVDSTGVVPGDSTIVQYSSSGAVQHSYQIAGAVDGLKYNPVTGMVWALQNNDGNATLSLINPTTYAVSAPLSYASPPYVYGTDSGRGYDDVAFRGNQVFLSYTNPANPTDSVVQLLNQGDRPSGTLTTTSILTGQQTGTLLPDIDSLKTTPSGSLVLTSEGDGVPTSDGRFTLIANPGAANQSLTNVYVTDGKGNNIQHMDDVLFPGATAGTLYVTDTTSNNVYAVSLSGLSANTAIASLGSFHEVGLVDLATGVATPLITGATLPGGALTGPHGLEFVPGAVPEPASWALMLAGFGLVGGTSRARRRLSITA